MHDLTIWRKNHRWNATAFAAEVGVSRDAIHRWERKHAMPNMQRIILIVRLTDGEVGPESWLPDEERRMLDEGRNRRHDDAAQENRT